MGLIPRLGTWGGFGSSLMWGRDAEVWVTSFIHYILASFPGHTLHGLGTGLHIYVHIQAGTGMSPCYYCKDTA